MFYLKQKPLAVTFIRKNRITHASICSGNHTVQANVSHILTHYLGWGVFLSFFIYLFIYLFIYFCLSFFLSFIH